MKRHFCNYSRGKACYWSLALGLLYVLSARDCCAQPIIWEGNGHAYEFILADGIDWPIARDAATTLEFEGIPGYLATVTSQAENDFIATIVEQAKTDHDLDVLREVWLGAEQLDPNAPPGDTWAWVACEAFKYTNWESGEPNDSGDEHFLGMWGPDGSGPLGQWNDQGDPFIVSNIEGFIVEYDLTLADVNQDGEVNLLDVAPFVNLTTSGTFQVEADINQDCVVDLLDIQPFVNLIIGG